VHMLKKLCSLGMTGPSSDILTNGCGHQAAEVCSSGSH